MEENSTINGYPEIIEISDELTMQIKRSNTFVPASNLALGVEVKNVKYIFDQSPGKITSLKKSKRILAYSIEGDKTSVAWIDIFEKIITTGSSISDKSLNVDQIDYFITKSNGLFDHCEHIVSLIELNGKNFFVKAVRDQKKGIRFEEIDITEDIPTEGKMKIFFSKE